MDASTSPETPSGQARPRKHVLALAAAALALGAAPLTASAQQTAYSTSPVAVGACNLSSETAPFSAGWYSNQISQEDLGYSFVNHNAVAATIVTLLVKGASATREIEDRGSFSPGVTIARNMLEGAAPESSSEGDNAPARSQASISTERRGMRARPTLRAPIAKANTRQHDKALNEVSFDQDP